MVPLRLGRTPRHTGQSLPPRRVDLTAGAARVPGSFVPRQPGPCLSTVGQGEPYGSRDGSPPGKTADGVKQMGFRAEIHGVPAEPHEGAGASSPEYDLDRIFTEYLDPIYRFLYARVGNREDAEDLTSNVFLKASRQLDPQRTEASVASWLFTVARTVLADHWRQYYRAPAPVELDDDMVPEQVHSPSAGEPSQSSQELVEAVLQGLPARYRRVLELRFLQGYSINEAARAMDVTPGNFKVLQHRALARAAELGFPDRETDGGQLSPALAGGAP